MNGFADLQQPVVQALGMAVLHSCWQGILMFCLVRMLLSFVPKQRPGTRYYSSYAALVLLFSGFLFSFFGEWQLATHQAHIVSVSDQVTVYRQTAVSLPAMWVRVISFRYAHMVNSYMPWIALCYAFGVLLLCGKMLWSIAQTRYLRKQVMLPDALLQQRMPELKAMAGIRKKVLLRFSEKVNVPLMFGYLKPVILIPLSLVNRLDSQQMEAVLLHELAHIKRNDYLWNLLQMIMETFLFFNPAAWFLSRIIRLEREHRCDDYVLTITKTPLPYAHALLLLEEHRVSVADTLMAASGHNKTSLLNRIKRMTSMKKEIRNSQRTLATITVVVLLAAMACFATAFGQEKKGEPKKINRSYTKVVVVDDNGKVTTYPKSDGDTTGMAEAMKAVPEALEQAGHALNNIDWENINKTIEMSLSAADHAVQDIDWKAIDKTIKMSMSTADKAMKEIDWNDIQSKVDDAMKEARVSMKDINWDEINAEMADARKEMSRAMKEARANMSDADWAEVSKALDEAKEEMKKAKIIMKQSDKERRSNDNDDNNDED